MQSDLVTIFGVGVLGFALLSAFVATVFTVEQRTIAIVQRLGKFVREAGPGIQVKIPFIDRVVGRVNLRVQQLDVEIETKTEDNLFVRMVVAVQYYVLPDKVYDAFYKLDNASRQITSFVFDVVRAQVPSAEGDAQSKALQGRGIADQRQAIVADQRDPYPALAWESQHPHRANAQRHDGG